MEPNAWLMIASGQSSQYQGHNGYQDELPWLYSYDSNVNNAKKVKEGDIAIFTDGVKGLGSAVIRRILHHEGKKTIRYCPMCRNTNLKVRTTMEPRYRCDNGHEFDTPSPEQRDVTIYQAILGDSFAGFPMAITRKDLRLIEKAPTSQGGIRPLLAEDTERFLHSLKSASRAAGGRPFSPRYDAPMFGSVAVREDVVTYGKASRGATPMTDFPITDRNKLLRLAKRGDYDRATIYDIVDRALICHVAYEIDGQPYILPTLHARVGDTILLHGHGTNRTLLHAGDNQPVAICITHVDGVVLARSIFNHSINYRSAVLFGNGRLITDPEEKNDALYRFTEKLQPGRWDDVRPMTDQEVKATAIIAVDIEQASAKVREGMPKDDEEDLAFPTWAGVIPIRTVVDDPLTEEHTPAEIGLPAYLREWVDARRHDISRPE